MKQKEILLRNLGTVECIEWGQKRSFKLVAMEKGIWSQFARGNRKRITGKLKIKLIGVV
jgi:hypothetical protein